MAYTVENGMWRAVFAVPSEIVDAHIKLIGEVPLKVLLTLLRYNGDLGVSALSAIVGRPEPVIAEALEYLLHEGLVQSPDFAPQQKAAAPPQEPLTASDEKPVRVAAKPAKEPAAERKITTHSNARRRYGRDEIASLAEQDEAVTWLLQESQSVLGKTLDATATDTIVAMYHYFGMKPDIVLMVLQYCAGIEKTSMGYVEKVAATWRSEGIETHEQAEREIKRRTELQSKENRVKSAFGIYDRALVPAEKKFVQAWFEEFGFDIPLITLAFERAVEVKGKLSFSYINGILKNWHVNGVATPADALREMSAKKERAQKQESAKGAKSSSYDLTELEAMLHKGTL